MSEISRDNVIDVISHLEHKIPNLDPIENIQATLLLCKIYFIWTLERNIPLQHLSRISLIMDNMGQDLNQVYDLQFNIYLEMRKYPNCQKIVQKSQNIVQKLQLSSKMNRWNQVVEIVEEHDAYLQGARVAIEYCKFDLSEKWLKLAENNIEYHFLSVNHFSAVGNTKEAIVRLQALHAFLEETIPLEERGTNRSYLMAYLLSGVVYKLSDGKKSKSFLSEGLKIVEYCLETEHDLFLKEVQMMLLQHLAQVCILRCEYVDAFEDNVLFVWALLFQQVERFDLSTSILKRLIGSDDPRISWIAKINLSIMPDTCPESLNAHQKSIENYMVAKSKLADKEFQQAKKCILSTLQLADSVCDMQLRALSLLLLAQVFTDTEKEQCLKMLTTGLALCQKKHFNDLYLAFANHYSKVSENSDAISEMSEKISKNVQSEKMKANELIAKIVQE